MTDKELIEVREAINQEYTLGEIYWKIANLDWTKEMFKLFINEILKEQRNDRSRN
jgi:hypothetical protein